MFDVKRRQRKTHMNENKVALVTAWKIDQSQEKEVKSLPQQFFNFSWNLSRIQGCCLEIFFFDEKFKTFFCSDKIKRKQLNLKLF